MSKAGTIVASNSEIDSEVRLSSSVEPLSPKELEESLFSAPYERSATEKVVVGNLDRNSSLEQVVRFLELIGETAMRLRGLPSIDSVDSMDDGDIAYLIRNGGAIPEITRLLVGLSNYEFTRQLRVTKNGKKAKKVKDFNDPNVMLAIRMAGHDFRNRLTPPISYYQMLEGNTSEVNYDKEWVKGMFEELPTIGTFAASLAFFGTGNPSFLYYVAGSEVKSIVREKEEIMRGVPCNIHYDIGPRSVPMVLCHIISQLVRNSKNNYKDHHKSLTTKCKEPYNIWVKIEDLGDYYRLIVKDEGTGFLDKEGNPFEAERLGKVFHPRYTTGGTGLGLGALPGYIERLDGAVQILTTNTKKGNSKYYSTLLGGGGEEPRVMHIESGTEITFTIPKC